MLSFAVKIILDLQERWQDSTLFERILFSVLLVVVLEFCYWLKFHWNPDDPSHLYEPENLQLDPANEDVRILILEPGSWDEPIRCRLEKTGLGTRPQFLALSYAWVENWPELDRESPESNWEYVLHIYRHLCALLDRHKYKKSLKYMRMFCGDLRKRVIYVNGIKHEVGVNLELALRHLRIDPELHSKVTTISTSNKGRNKRYELAIWADAVCINQDDVDDRSKQVASMREVYKQAERVEIWLGVERDFRAFETQQPSKLREQSFFPENPRHGEDSYWFTEAGGNARVASDVNDEVRSLATAQKTAKCVKQTLESWEKYHNRPRHLRAVIPDIEPDYTLQFFCMIHLFQSEAFKYCNEMGKRALDDRVPFLKQASTRAHVLEVFEEVMRRLWWKRLWVVQETVIAKKVNVRYGRFVIPWENLVLAADNLKTHRYKECCVDGFDALHSGEVDVLTRFADTILGLDIWRRIWNEDLREPRLANIEIGLLRLLWQFRDRDTAEPRDKVFALLPLVTTEGIGKKHRRIIPNYQWSVRDIYVMVLRTLLTNEGSLIALAGNAKKSKDLSDLPSWVPDWSERSTAGELDRLKRMRLYSASGDRNHNPRILGKNEFLELKGIKHSVIKLLGPVMVSDADAEGDVKSRKTFQDWERLAFNTGPSRDEQYHGFNYTRETAYYRTLCMGTTYNGKSGRTARTDVERTDFNLETSDDFCKGLGDWEAYLHEHGKGEGSPKTHPSTTCRRKSSSDKSARNGNITQIPENDIVRPLELLSSDEPRSHFPLHPVRRNTLQNHLQTQVNEAVESATVSRRFFVTDTGHIGLAPPETQEGDLVFILFGGQIPFILRDAGKRDIPRGSGILDGIRSKADEGEYEAEQAEPTPLQRVRTFGGLWPRNDGQHLNSGQGMTQCYKLIGDSYVQGVMTGEAMQDNKKTDQEAVFVYLV